MLGTEERHRALDDALDTARVVSAAGRGAAAGEARFRVAARALETFAPDSPWLHLLGKEDLFAAQGEVSAYVAIGETLEERVPFDLDAIAAALRDEARGRRHFPGYRVREEQVGSRSPSRRTWPTTRCSCSKAAPASGSRSPTSRPRSRSR